MAEYDDWWGGSPPVGRDITLAPGLENRVSVMDPSNPGQLIWVEARRGPNGDLVPVDPRYDVRAGFQSVTSAGASGGSSTLLVIVALVGLYFVTRH